MNTDVPSGIFPRPKSDFPEKFFEADFALSVNEAESLIVAGGVAQYEVEIAIEPIDDLEKTAVVVVNLLNREQIKAANDVSNDVMCPTWPLLNAEIGDVPAGEQEAIAPRFRDLAFVEMRIEPAILRAAVIAKWWVRLFERYGHFQTYAGWYLKVAVTTP